MARTSLGAAKGPWIRVCVLLLLAEQPAHGYELLRGLEGLGAHHTDTGTLYRVLRRTERDGLTFSIWEDAESGPPRRVYELTSIGRDVLEEEMQALETSRDLMDGFLSRCRNLTAVRSSV